MFKYKIYLIIYELLFLLIIFLLGFYIGFEKNTFNITIFYNLLPLILLELLRTILLKLNYKNNKILYFIL